MSSNTTLDATLMLPSISCKLKIFVNSFSILFKNNVYIWSLGAELTGYNYNAYFIYGISK